MNSSGVSLTAAASPMRMPRYRSGRTSRPSARQARTSRRLICPNRMSLCPGALTSNPSATSQLAVVRLYWESDTAKGGYVNGSPLAARKSYNGPPPDTCRIAPQYTFRSASWSNAGRVRISAHDPAARTKKASTTHRCPAGRQSRDGRADSTATPVVLMAEVCPTPLAGARNAPSTNQEHEQSQVRSSAVSDPSSGHMRHGGGHARPDLAADMTATAGSDASGPDGGLRARCPRWRVGHRWWLRVLPDRRL